MLTGYCTFRGCESTLWKCENSEHYSIFYHPDSTAEKELIHIVEWQEKCFQKLSYELDMTLDHPIRMYLCDSPEEIAQTTGCPACNGMTFDYDLIYAVYNESVRCLGPHEDAHLFSYQIAIPESFFLREGFAMYFDECYHGRHNAEIAKEWFQSKKSFSITSLIDNRVFRLLPENISYPLAGAFVSWIIQSYGITKYLEVYRNGGDFSNSISLSSAAIDSMFKSAMTENKEGCSWQEGISSKRVSSPHMSS